MAFTRREFLSSSSTVVVATAFGRVRLLAQAPVGASAGQAAQAPPVTKFEDVRRGVGVFTGQGGTIGWLLTPDGALAVDSQYPQTAAACLAGLKERSPKGIQLLINTHHHPDHVSGNPTFRPAVSRIVQQERCAKYHQTTTEKAGTLAQQAFADVTFGESWSTTIGNEKIWANYYGPGHTGGDAVIFFEGANVVHMGDLMFNRRHPFIDRPNGASIRNWIRILEQTAKKHKDAVFICGHAKQGLPVTVASTELLAFRDYFSALLEYVQNGIRAKKSQTEIAAIDALPKFEDYAPNPPLVTVPGVLTTAYEELTKKPIVA